jgi:polar amino acid transport system substrate-binding protein
VRSSLKFAGLYCATLAPLALHPVSAACSRVLRVGWVAWPPYSVEGPRQQPLGLDVELVSRIAQEAGCTVEFVRGIPPPRQLFYLRQSTLDLQFAASDVPERHAFAWVSKPYRAEIISLFARSGEAARYAPATLDTVAKNHWHLIAPDAGWFGASYQALRPQFQAKGRLSVYRTTTQGMQMLNTHRGDLVLGDHYAFVHESLAKGIPPLDPLPIPVNEAPIHLLLSKTSLQARDMDTLNAAIERLTRSGALRDIETRYRLSQGRAPRR